MSADGLVVEELICSSEVLEEFKIETRKAKIKWFLLIFLAYNSKVCVIQSADLDEELVFMVVLIASSKASDGICNHETRLYAHPIYFTIIWKFFGQFPKLVSWNSHFSFGIGTSETTISSSVHEIIGIILTNIVYLHLKLFRID